MENKVLLLNPSQVMAATAQMYERNQVNDGVGKSLLDATTI
jgi:hypothetical protein